MKVQNIAFGTALTARFRASESDAIVSFEHGFEAIYKQHARFVWRVLRGMGFSDSLQQEQLVTRILALCILRRNREARALARALQRAARRSPHLARIHASCARQFDKIALK